MADKIFNDFTERLSPTGNEFALVEVTPGVYQRVKLSNLGVTGGGGGDTTPPTVVSATVQNAAPNQVVVVFSESVTVTTSGWSFRRNASNWAISSVAGSGTTWTFTMATSAANGETIDRSYNSATGATVDGAANELASFTNSSVTNNVGGGYQTESDAFFAVNTGLTTGEKNAVDALVVSLKGIGWSKFQAIYPFVGGTAAAHKWNLKNPVDTDGGFRMTFHGTVTHSASGIAGNGSTGYGDTKFVPSTNYASNQDAHFVISSSAGTTGGRHGSTSNSGANEVALMPSVSGSFFGRMMGAVGENQVTAANTDLSDVFAVTRRGSTSADIEAYKGGTSLGNASGTPSLNNAPTTAMYVLAQNDGGTAGYFSDLTINFVSIGTGLTDAEMSTLATAVNTYNTALSR